MAEGIIIRHEKLEEILRYKRGSSRYYGVINSWITRQRNENSIKICWEPTIGLRVLDPVGLLSHTVIRTRQKCIQVGRVMKMFAWVDRDRLDENGKKRLDHQLLVAAKIREVVRLGQKDLAVEIGPIKSLPKRQLPGVTA